MKKPIKRSALRLLAGRTYYNIKTYYSWYFSKTNFASILDSDKLPIEIFSHKTVLLRKLKDIDLWMQKNKIINLNIAIKKLDGLIIEPGETFSYWRKIGRVTKRKGYIDGMLLHNGTVKSGTGGGLCQLSNLIFWMTLNTPLIITERWRHGYDVFPDVKRNQPFGSGATCSYPNIDLRIKNNTNQRFQLSLEVTDTHLVGRWFSNEQIDYRYEILEKNHQIKNEWWGGYTRNNEIFRNVINVKNGHKEEEFITKNSAIMMYDPFLENKIEN